MNLPHSRPRAASKPDGRAPKAGSAAVAPVLALGLPILVFTIDYIYLGPIVRFFPFIVWTAAALGMGAYAAVPWLASWPG
jgi:hypothetical protein